MNSNPFYLLAQKNKFILASPFLAAYLHSIDKKMDILNFYGWWQFSVCTFAFFGLMAIWYHIGRKKGDVGQVFLALSILSWAISGLVEVYFNSVLASINHVEDSSAVLTGWRSVLSLFNSLFILLSLPWFRHLPSFLEGIIKSPYWKVIVGLPFLFSILPTLSKIFTGNDNGIISELDVYYSILTLCILACVLWSSFVKRNLKILAYLSIVSILITFAAQLYKLTDSYVNLILFSAIFKTSLIMIFFALALSWVKDFTQRLDSNTDHVKLFLKQKKSEKGFQYFAQLDGVQSFLGKEVRLNEKYALLLEKFILRKQEGEGWLEIKPKSFNRDGRAFDINDHNEVKRLLIVFLDDAFGKNLWSKVEHYDPLKSVLFEMSKNRERKIRLALDKEDLHIQNQS